MTGAAPWALAGGGMGDGLVAVVGVGLLALVAVLFALLLLSRRRLGRDVREVVQALEDLRLGQGRPRSEADVDSPLALVFDAIARLGEDLAARVRGAESRSEQVRAVMAAMNDHAVITTDIDGEITGFSPGARHMMGWDESQLDGRPVSMLFEEASYKEFLPKLARRSLREQGVTSRATLQRKDGDPFEAEVSVRMLHGAAGDPSGFLLVAREVSEQVELEGRLRESEQRYRSLVEGLADGVLIVRDGEVLYANSAFAELCGEDAERLVGSPLRRVVATRDLLLVEDRLADVQRGAAETAELVCRLGGENAVEREVSLRAAAVGYDGAPAVRVVARDETAERRVVAELRRNESQLDAVIEATSDGILVMVEGPQGRLVKMTNRGFLDRFGLHAGEVLGTSEKELLQLLRSRGRAAAAVASYLESAVQGEQPEVLAAGGRRLGDLELTVRPLRDADDAPIGRLLACHDLTEQRESERRMQLHAEEQQLSKVMLERAYRRIDRANKDLQARTEQLDRLNAELRKLNEMKSNLLGNVSHELQTPLVSIRGYTEMILKERLGPITDEQRRGLSLGLKNIDRLISMIDNLLVFSRSEADLGPLKLERFSLRPLIEESLELLADKVREKRVHTVVRIEGEGPTIHADRDKIQQVFINLLSNAVKFNRPDGRVMLSVERAKPGYVAIVVEDSGVGIPADALDHVFERHYQVAADPDDSPRGSGIGLAIVQDILRSHGCRIDVSSEAGHGARFRFTLPLAGVTRRPAEPGDVGGEAAPAPAPEDDAPSAASSTSAPSGPAHPAEHGAGESADRSSDESPDQSPRDSDERHTPAADPIDSGDDVPERVGPPRPRPRFRIIRRPS